MRNFAHELIDAGADVVFGHSAHHMLPVKRYRKGLIIYGLGEAVADFAIEPSLRSDLSALVSHEIEEAGSHTLSIQMLQRVQSREGGQIPELVLESPAALLPTWKY